MNLGSSKTRFLSGDQNAVFSSRERQAVLRVNLSVYFIKHIGHGNKGFAKVSGEWATVEPYLIIVTRLLVGLFMPWF